MAKYFIIFGSGVLPKQIRPSICVIRSKSPHDVIRLRVSLLGRFFEIEVVKHDNRTVFTPYNENRVYNIL